MGLFNHHQEQRITINGQAVSVDELVDRYNQLIQKVDDLQKHTGTTMIVDGQQMTATDVQNVVDQWQDAAKQAKSAADQVADLKAENAELRAAQSITMGNKPITVNELIDRYNDLLKQLQQAQNQARELQNQVDEPASLVIGDEEWTVDDVQDLIDQRQDAVDQAKSAADQVAELKDKNAMLAEAVLDKQTLEVAGKHITIDELFDRYNGLLAEYQDARNEVYRLQNQPKVQVKSILKVDGDDWTVDDIGELLDQRDENLDEIADLKSKNAELAKTAQSVQGLKINGKPVTIDEVIKNYNESLDRLQQADQVIKQLKEQPISLTVNGQKITVDDVQRLIAQRETVTAQVAGLKDKNDELAKTVQAAQTQLEQLQEQSKLQDSNLRKAEQEAIVQRKAIAAAKEVIVNGERIPVTELVKRYSHLLQQRQSSQPLTNFQPAPQPQRVQSTGNPIAPSLDAEQEKLIDRYYQIVKSVLGEYQDRVAEFQQKLTACLDGNGLVEFLQLEENKISPSSYQKMFLERNKQMIRYIENHQYQEDLVRPKDQKKNPHDELRGVRYWANFVYRYRWVLSKLLDKNKNVHRDFKYAHRYDKATAQQISESKPSYLSDQNLHDLRTIQSGIEDESAWKKEMGEFFRQANSASKGAEGERLVNNVVKSYAYNRVLTSMNLPFQYQKGKKNSNQIDCIVVNQKGIFVLEIKNYTADTIGIDQDGFIVVKKDGKRSRYSKITQQGQLHYKAVLSNLKADEMTKPLLPYLKNNLHVLYVSTNPHAEIESVYPNANPHYHFISLDGLRKYIDSTKGRLDHKDIQAVVEVLDNRQQAEKRYDYFCFPTNPEKRAEDGWRQYNLMRQLYKLKLDDLVDRYDPDIRQQLDAVGLVTRDGFVTSKPHNSK